ncbi:exosortase system-associated protein, TIGR04073 family [bacterium]|nr:exosortase system-associated protein, TIGR04073 family [bacterium]MCK4326167.1 exosortase system-associated protein, TIGR04073 family [bacterium]
MNVTLKRLLGAGVIMAVILGGLIPECGAANPLHKIGRGLKNIVIAPVEIPVGIVNWSKDRNPFVGLVIGPVAGAVNCVTRATAGVVEVITFPLPPYNQPLYERELGETIWE